jgi:hypothetical protein
VRVYSQHSLALGPVFCLESHPARRVSNRPVLRRYVGVALGYGMLDILLLIFIWRTDFQLYADKAMARSEVKAVKSGK